VAQVNYTQTKLKGSIRGLHFQAAPKTEMKLVMCLAGSIHDVAIDLRRDSPTFLRTHQQILSQDNNTALLIPEGCAHGFQALTNDVALIYMHSMPFDADCERGFSAFDPKIGISWPLPVGPMSDRDCLLPLVGHDFHGI
jgi:dTDP-4-dehydrorhamnose 3,5-epimerase